MVGYLGFTPCFFLFIMICIKKFMSILIHYFFLLMDFHYFNDCLYYCNEKRCSVIGRLEIKKILIQWGGWCSVCRIIYAYYYFNSIMVDNVNLLNLKEGEMINKKTEHPISATLDLRGRQSVRATFKLSERAIESLSLVAVHLGIKQKSLFDHLIENAGVLEDLVDTIRIRQFKKIDRIQKTYVLSRRTLDVLEMISKAHNTPRDALVEYSIRRLESVILAEKSRHEKRKELFGEVVAHFNSSMDLLQKSRDALGEDDPFCRNVERAMAACLRTKNELAVFIEKSSLIEEY